MDESKKGTPITGVAGDIWQTYILRYSGKEIDEFLKEVDEGYLLTKEELEKLKNFDPELYLKIADMQSLIFDKVSNDLTQYAKLSYVNNAFEDVNKDMDERFDYASKSITDVHNELLGTNEAVNDIEKSIESVNESIEETKKEIEELKKNPPSSGSTPGSPPSTDCSGCTSNVNAAIQPDEPDDEEAIWFDTDGGQSINSSESAIITEMKTLIQALSKQVKSLTERVEYLELNGSHPGDGDDEEDDDIIDPLPDDLFEILLEDGTTLLLEDGTSLLLEELKQIVTEDSILLEDGTYLLLEDGTVLLLEQQKQVVVEKTLLLEDKTYLLLEDNTKILLE